MLDLDALVTEADTSVDEVPTVDITLTEAQVKFLLTDVSQHPVGMMESVNLYSILSQASENFAAWHEANDD